MQFDSPIRGLTCGITWNESLGGKIKQIAILPLALLLILLLIAMMPIAYIFHLWEVYQKKKELENLQDIFVQTGKEKDEVSIRLSDCNLKVLNLEKTNEALTEKNNYLKVENKRQ